MGSWPLPSDLLFYPMVSSLRLSLPTTSALSLSLLPLLLSWYFLKLIPQESELEESA